MLQSNINIIALLSIFHQIEKTKNKYPYAQSKSLAALPCKLRFATKHLLFCHRTRSIDKSVQLNNEMYFVSLDHEKNRELRYWTHKTWI
jgi:hypothetical protein